MKKNGIFDLGITWSSLDDSFFARILQKKCNKAGISFLWIDDLNKKSMLRRILKGETAANILMDTEATYEDPEDIYAKISYAVKDAGGMVFNDPDITQLAIDKAYMYHSLRDSGISVPYTYIIRKWIPGNYTLSEKVKKALGKDFIIKPAHGYAQKGLIRKASGSSYQIRKARKFDTSDSFLLQKRVDPVYYDGKKAWFRILKIFDTMIPCWWDDTTNKYQEIYTDEMRKYRLERLFSITKKIAEITDMDWFSTEIAVVRKGKGFDFISIDPVNDQCDLTPRSEEPNGIPDKLLTIIAEIMFRNIRNMLKK